MREVLMPDWPKLLDEIHGSGLTNSEIAKKIFWSPSHTAHIRRGHRQARPCWLVGNLILSLYRETFGDKPIPEKKIDYLGHIGGRRLA